MKLKSVRGKNNAQRVYREFEIDTGVIEALNSVERRAAIETGQEQENVSITGNISAKSIALSKVMSIRELEELERKMLAAMEAERSALNQDVVLDHEAIAVLAKHGMKISEVTPTELEEWKACSSPVSEGFLARSGETGEKVMAEYRKLLVGFSINRGPPRDGSPRGPGR